MDKQNIKVVFKNNEGETISLTTSLKGLIDNTEEDLLLSLESDCCESSCAVNGFCECGGIYEDYELYKIEFLNNYDLNLLEKFQTFIHNKRHNLRIDISEILEFLDIGEDIYYCRPCFALEEFDCCCNTD